MHPLTTKPSYNNSIQKDKPNTSYLVSLSSIWNRISSNIDNSIGDEDCTDNLIRSSISSSTTNNNATESKDDITPEESKTIQYYLV